MPLVSVIINVRNGAQYLREAIDSVLAQTFADWELVLWDDCSTDNSAEIIAETSKCGTVCPGAYRNSTLAMMITLRLNSQPNRRRSSSGSHL